MTAKPDLASERDMQAAYLALCRWFDSQDIDLADGGYLCAQVAGLAVGLHAEDQGHLERGVKLLAACLQKRAEEAYAHRRKKRRSKKQ